MSSSEDDDLLLLTCAILLKKKTLKKKKKKEWMNTWHTLRKRFTPENILQELNNKEDYRNVLKMDSATFDELLSMVKPSIAKQNTVMRQAIPPNMRLSATLRYLATGEKFEDLQFCTAISARSLGKIVIETCEAIISNLSNYIKEPRSESEWKATAEDFYGAWNFPNCLGAIDGMHIAIKKPSESGLLYFNYKKFFSVVLLATVNANYEFIMADVGTNGRISEGGDITNTAFGKAIYDNSLFIPPPSQIPHSSKVLPYVFVGDNAFQMQENLLKPYSDATLTTQEHIFNNKLSSVRRIIENVFGILVSRFGVLQTTIGLSPEKAKTIILTCCYLHNFLRKKKSYEFSELIDKKSLISGDLVNGIWRKGANINALECIKLKNASMKAHKVREDYAEYFSNEGAVSWQKKMKK